MLARCQGLAGNDVLCCSVQPDVDSKRKKADADQILKRLTRISHGTVCTSSSQTLSLTGAPLTNDPVSYTHLTLPTKA